MTGSKGGAGNTGAGKTRAGKGTYAGKGDPSTPIRNVRASKPPLEKEVNPDAEATTSWAQARAAPYEELIEKLGVPVTTRVDTHLAEAELEQRCQVLLKEALMLSELKRQLEITIREYNQAHEFTLAGTEPSRIGEVRRRGRGLNAEIDRDARSSSSKVPSHMTAEKPKYSSAAKTLRVVDAARAELSGLSGEARRKQQDRVNELVAKARQQNEAFQRANPIAGGSQIVNSAKAASARSKG